MNLSSTSHDISASNICPPAVAKCSTLHDEAEGNHSLYDSALENLTSNASFDECGNNKRFDEAPTTSKNSSKFTNSSCEWDSALNSNNQYIRTYNSNRILLQSESTDTNTSQEEFDMKSQLANKTIFKTDNPNLSIVEINDSLFKEQELKNSIVLIESFDEIEIDKIETKKDKSPKKLLGDLEGKGKTSLNNCKKHQLNLCIAETSANELENSSNKINFDISSDESEISAQSNKIRIYDTINEFDENLPSTVTLLETPFGSKVYLVGTAHFSEQSQNDVSYVIRNVRPDVVMVELCPSRVHILKLDEKTLLEEAKNFNLAKIRSIIQAHGYINGIFFILLLQMSAQIAKDLGMAPGGEFRRAFQEVRDIPGCVLHLGDRPIRITLHRALRALSLWQTLKLVWRITSTDTISIEEVEECKQRDLLEKLMQEMAGEFPAFSDVFVKERDLFLCHSLQLAALPNSSADGVPRPVRVVGVVGIGHANGIAQLWGNIDPQTIQPILEIPPASISTRLFKYTIKYGLIGLTVFGAFKVIKPRIIRFF